MLGGTGILEGESGLRPTSKTGVTAPYGEGGALVVGCGSPAPWLLRRRAVSGRAGAGSTRNEESAVPCLLPSRPSGFSLDLKRVHALFSPGKLPESDSCICSGVLTYQLGACTFNFSESQLHSCVGPDAHSGS